MEKNDMISYAMDLVSYLVLKNKDIERVILYGSVPRGDFDEGSDIDLFIDSQRELETKIKKSIEDYKKTNKAKEWDLKGIRNEFHIINGRLDNEEWKDLKRSIMNNGTILYGKYKSDIDKINHYLLFTFENIKPDKKRIVVFRKLFGFSIGKIKYQGLVQKTNSIKIGKGSILVPIENAILIKDYLKEKKIDYKVYDFWSDNKIN